MHTTDQLFLYLAYSPLLDVELSKYSAKCFKDIVICAKFPYSIYDNFRHLLMCLYSTVLRTKGISFIYIDAIGIYKNCFHKLVILDNSLMNSCRDNAVQLDRAANNNR